MATETARVELEEATGGSEWAPTSGTTAMATEADRVRAL
ncbi:hypothetical protein PF005_g13990 [Phytophthora fragariae]|uniref:Uncharacterized protein n=1 Tax=Phytophthora fragariae TaxID=53985 RepID=A0A6A3U7D7_9STRA|nr:hypothetical protein PF003_g15276 [Phytophthora fragariae]KAE8934710.1 hypothetical protein PF009_g15316 [Phytophthora fragariae]KAE8980831.1 hypothetical protein PF011_g22274 [Phytophthora fragariae]KAE9079133.1 hypothetical protein PF010_g22862 [Phytophthora fragariae]KAE9107678.1 hypothetical protein PF007_g12961 [Phytophthora fragariae]